MPVTIDLPAELEQRLKLYAQSKQLPVNQFIAELLTVMLKSDQLIELIAQQSEKVEPLPTNSTPTKQPYSFIGLGRSGKATISAEVETVLAEAADREEGWSLP